MTAPQVSATAVRRDTVESLAELSSRLDGIEQKLDHLLALVAGEQERHDAGDAVFAVLRADGLCFSWPEVAAPGELIEVTLTLSLVPPSMVRCLVEVLSCVEDPAVSGAHLIDARFSAITAADQDAIGRYIFTSQRRQRAARLEG